MAKTNAKEQINGALPRGSKRIMALIERSRPSPGRPRLSEEFEAQLQEVHSKSAACYASMEDLGDRIEQLAQHIAEDDGVVMAAIDGDSVVTHIEEVSRELQASHHRLAAAAPTPRAGTPTVDEPSEAAPAAVSGPKRATTH